MKRSSLLLLALLALSAAAAVLPQKSRCNSHHGSRAVNSRDPYFSPAALRWRQCQHAHWRACMLQH